MYSHDNPDILWVCPTFTGSGNGTFEAPYTEVNEALKNVKPGSTIVLQAGEYIDNVNIQDSGTITEPIRIVADNNAQNKVFCLSTWFLYDVSDIIISGLSFINIPQQAISVIGNCERNNFSKLNFINCGLDKKAPCTFYFGGSGSKCNVVENCSFKIESKKSVDNTKPELPIALMVSEGDVNDNTKLNTNHVFRGNIFTNYGCAVIIGIHDNTFHNYSHIFENNIIRDCSNDGMRVKCGDTVINSNVFLKCQGKAISIAHGKTDVICNNRIEKCETGIHINGYDCTVKNNCIVESLKQAIAIKSKGEKKGNSLGTTFIEENTCIDSKNKEGASSKEIVLIDTNSNCIIQRNIFSGKKPPYTINNEIKTSKQQNIIHIVDNIISKTSHPVNGCIKKQISFKDQKSGNYTTRIKYGAKGWMAAGSKILFNKDKLTKKKTPGENLPENIDASQVDGLISEVNEKEFYVRSLFLDAEMNNMAETSDENPSDEIPNEDGMIDFSDWD